MSNMRMSMIQWTEDTFITHFITNPANSEAICRSGSVGLCLETSDGPGIKEGSWCWTALYVYV
jgi:hypothetical protein